MKNIFASGLILIAFSTFLLFSFTPNTSNEIKEYMVVQVYSNYPSDTKTLVERSVNPYIKEGWQPIGGLCEAGGGYYYQVMVK